MLRSVHAVFFSGAYRMEAAIFLFALAFYSFFSWAMPVTDPVESNYALTAKEMLASGDYLSPRIYGAYWYDKPGLVYWLLLASFKLFGVGAFAARLPMAIAAALSLAFFYWFVRRFFARDAALWGALTLATSLQFWLLGKLVVTDMALFLFDGAALGWLYAALRTGGRFFALAAWGAAGLAVLTKGPVGIVLPGMIAAAYLLPGRRRALWRRLRPLGGLGVFAAVALPWYAYMYAAHGGAFVEGFLGLHNVGRALVSEHPDDNVFYYYLLVVPVCLLPWSGLFLCSLFWRGTPAEAAEGGAFLKAWFWGVVLFYSLMATKYPTYAFLALFPAAALMGLRLAALLSRAPRRSFWLWVTAPLALELAALGGAAVRFAPEAWRAASGAVFAALLLAVLLLQLRGSGRRVACGAVCASALASLWLSFAVLPEAARLRSAEGLAHLTPGAAVACYEDYQTSAVFYTGRPIVKLQEAGRGGGVWAGKHTMPCESAAAFAADTRGKAAYVFVFRDKDERFRRSSLGAAYRLAFAGRRFNLYEKRAAASGD